jgi:mono/diheme cytochrome c family protein
VKRLLLSAIAASALLAAGCRGAPSSDPPIQVFLDLDNQQKYKPEAKSEFFPDGRAMRPLVDGTVAQGELREDDGVYRGKNADGTFLAVAPIHVDEQTLRRGQERFNVYCAPCHDQAGSGHGVVVRRGYPAPIDLAGDRVRGLPDGEIFNVVTNGVRNMPAYRKQIPVEDRWKIVAWVRALGRSQHASLADVPPEQKSSIAAETAQ